MRNDIGQRSDITSESYSAVNCLPEHDAFLVSAVLCFQRAGRLLWSYVWDAVWWQGRDGSREYSLNCISKCHTNMADLKLSPQIKSLLQVFCDARHLYSGATFRAGRQTQKTQVQTERSDESACRAKCKPMCRSYCGHWFWLKRLSADLPAEMSTCVLHLYVPHIAVCFSNKWQHAFATEESSDTEALI